MTQLYWQVYLNLEREFLALSDTIYINDIQQEVYSMRIADLLIRTVIEIEALAKDLYLCNGGEVKSDKDLYFDTVCMAYLNKLWKLDQKVVLVSSPNIYFEKDENKILFPLNKADKRGTSSSDWNKAYQAVKHNRVKDLSKGNLKHLLHGLAALYVLNLYYIDKRLENLTFVEKSNVDSRFGSCLFAVKIHYIDIIQYNGSYKRKEDYDNCVFIEDYETTSKEKADECKSALEEYGNQCYQSELNKLLKGMERNGEELSQEMVDSMRKTAFEKMYQNYNRTYLYKYSDSLNAIRYNIVLNKQQY